MTRGEEGGRCLYSYRGRRPVFPTHELASFSMYTNRLIASALQPFVQPFSPSFSPSALQLFSPPIDPSCALCSSALSALPTIVRSLASLGEVEAIRARLVTGPMRLCQLARSQPPNNLEHYDILGHSGHSDHSGGFFQQMTGMIGMTRNII